MLTLFHYGESCESKATMKTSGSFLFSVFKFRWDNFGKYQALYVVNKGKNLQTLTFNLINQLLPLKKYLRLRGWFRAH